MTRKKHSLFLLLSLCLTLPAHAFGIPQALNDSIPAASQEDDPVLLREIFASDTFDKIADIAMIAPEVQTVPDSVIRRRLAALDARTPLSLEFNPEVRTYINMYLGKRREMVARMVGLS